MPLDTIAKKDKNLIDQMVIFALKVINAQLVVFSLLIVLTKLIKI